MSTLRATARLQLHNAFTFDDAVQVVPYYADLGISHIYASPILTARRGSTHGYDIVDPTRINPELGGEEGLRRLVAAIRAAGMALILDIVPNHMGVGPENPWWQHVLEWGRKSPYAHWFDIDWQPADETLHGKVLAPFLGQPYGEVLAAGDIALHFDPTRGKIYVGYFSHRFPVAPADYPAVLQATGSERLAAAASLFGGGRGTDGCSPATADRGFGRLRELYESPQGRAELDAALAAFSAATPQGFEALHNLLERQHYRLAWWRVAADGINWRRFFEVTDLAGVRVEQDEVFEATHALIFRLYSEGLIDGVRVDHVDGLADPGAYCRKLRHRLQALTAQRPPHLAPTTAYLIVEKILAPEEDLRVSWETDGTSGYDFMDRVGALLHDPAGEAPLTALWQEVTGHDQDFPAEVRQARRQLLSHNLAGEFEAAARALHAVARTDLRTRDFSLGAIRRVFAELLVHFPVYRTYVDSCGRDRIDDEVIERALIEARPSVDRTEQPLLDVLARWLGGDAPRDAANPRVRHLHQRAITRFQQLTPPLAAKSVEDTAFYRYGRLLSRNEVGSDPGQFSLSVAGFHAANRRRGQLFPRSLLATATHDHKRGEDVRARIAVLSELPHEWAQAVREWMEINAVHRTEVPAVDGAPGSLAPLPADELMLYQMLAGAWPADLQPADVEGVKSLAERLDQWQTKALREAKQVSDWVMPNEAYESACRDFLHRILSPDADSPFLARLWAWINRVAPLGAAKGLAQTALRLTVPGVPDLYQGTDFWDYSLVDPDNRRPVDYTARIQALAEAPALISGLQGWHSGIVKQQLIRCALGLRARMPALFAAGEYIPLQVHGPLARHVTAFARRHERECLVVAVLHLPAAVMEVQEGIPRLRPPAEEASHLILPTGLTGPLRDPLVGATVHPQEGRVDLNLLLGRLPVVFLLGQNPTT